MGSRTFFSSKSINVFVQGLKFSAKNRPTSLIWSKNTYTLTRSLHLAASATCMLFNRILHKKSCFLFLSYARQCLRTARISRHSRLRAWRRVTPPEMQGFISVILNMGLIKKNTITEYWSRRSSQSTSWFWKMFARNRFQMLLKFFHLVDNERIPPRNSPHYRYIHKIRGSANKFRQ